MIHLEHHAGPLVASKAIAIMQSGGVWLIWCAGDEGFLMATSDSPRAAMVRKHWSTEVVGEYTASIEHDELVAAMKEARRIQLWGERGMGKGYLSREAYQTKLDRKRARRRAEREQRMARRLAA